MTPLSVTDVTQRIKGLLDADRVLADVWIEGEISNTSQARSGHWYWTVKDEGAQLRCVMFRMQASFQSHFPSDGERFLLHGSVSVYVAQGQHQLYVDHCEPAGRGDLHREFERVKAKLEAEGLFDAANKRKPPAYPARIGVVTSADAAALRDICTVIRRRWTRAEVLLAPTVVQGSEAPSGIRRALRAVVRAGVDVVIVARGGGSLEDLWAFNDEGVARAVRACPVPVISGVGHETDFTICDFVADVRAPTPSAAAELATPDRTQLAQRVDTLEHRALTLTERRIRVAGTELGHLDRRLDRTGPQRRLESARQGLAGYRAQIRRSVRQQVVMLSSRLEGLDGRLTSLSPDATLKRGYAHVRRSADGGTVRRVADATPGGRLTIRVADGSFPATADGPRPTAQPSLFEQEENPA